MTFSPDRHRPRFHLLPPSGWLNDPNGVVHWRGRYHVFYQHNPLAPSWAPPHWAHAVSDDLVHWTHLPTALTPDMPPADEGGCWSGCLVDDDGTPTILYTGVRDGVQTVGVATGSDDLVRWRKWPDNPVARVPEALADHTLEAYRDPYVWREGDLWHALVGTSIGGTGQVLYYQSADLRSWTYRHPFVPTYADPVCDDTGQIWECPNFFSLGEAHVLLVSRWQRTELTYPNALIGAYRDERFEPERRARLDWGYRCFYAPLTNVDDHGRRLMWGWLQEQRHVDRAKGWWAGVMSLPRVLTLEAGVLRQRFVPELEALRVGQTVHLVDVPLRDPHAIDVGGRGFELRATIERGDAAMSRIRLRHSEAEHTDVTIAWNTGRLIVDTRQAKGPYGADHAVDTAVLVEPGGTLTRTTLHLIVDQSVVELIADDRHALTTRVYPEGAPLDRLEVAALGGEDRIVSLEAWALAAGG
jgi:beta-fructofuranosidase